MPDAAGSCVESAGGLLRIKRRCEVHLRGKLSLAAIGARPRSEREVSEGVGTRNFRVADMNVTLTSY